MMVTKTQRNIGIIILVIVGVLLVRNILPLTASNPIRICGGTCPPLGSPTDCNPCGENEVPVGCFVNPVGQGYPSWDSPSDYCNAFNKPSDSWAKQCSCETGTPLPECAKEGESCGFSEDAPVCCVGLDCQNFGCVEVGICNDGDEICGSVGFPNVPGEVLYKCIGSTWKSQGRVDKECGFVGCGTAGDSCSEFSGGCCEPFYTCESNQCVLIRPIEECETCDDFAISKVLGSLFPKKQCEPKPLVGSRQVKIFGKIINLPDLNFPQTVTTCFLSILRIVIIPFIFLFSYLFGAQFLPRFNILRKNRSLLLGINIFSSLLISYFVYLTFITGIILFVAYLVIISSIKLGGVRQLGRKLI